jgi:hypothetical protein
MSDSLRAWLQIHFCVLLWGFTAILGKAITLPALPLARISHKGGIPSDFRAGSGMKDRFAGVVRHLMAVRRERLAEQGEFGREKWSFRHTSA